ncbi:DNA primase [Spirochaetia bacterium]|nr:DNA primase [Spirochaetia bacterium]
MARFTEASKQAVIDSIDTLSVAGDYLRLEKKGGRYWGLCPFHGEKTPSFTVDPDRKTYKCFGCGKGGSIVSFLMEMDKLTFPEAMEALSKRSGVPLIYEEGSGFDRTEKEAAEALEELYRRVAASFHHILMNKTEGERAKQYILDRGISPAAIELFRLGYAPSDRTWLHQFLLGKGFSEAFLGSSGLFSQKYPRSAFFSARLMFPIADKNGKTVGFGGRILEGDGPKYINSQESALFKKGRTLFALDLALPEIRRTKEVYLAEGYMDVIALHQGGVTNAVAPLGTAFTDDQAKLLKRWAERVCLMLDNDEAGQKAVYKTILSCRKNGLDCLVVDTRAFFKENEKIPKDPAEILQKFGPEALKNSVKCSILDLEFVISRSRALTENKAEQVKLVFPYLDALDSETGRDASIGVIADAFGVERRAVWDDFAKARERGFGNSGYPLKRNSGTAPEGSASRFSGKDQAGPGNESFRAGDELYLLGTVLLNPGYFREFRTGISLDELEDPRARELYIILEDWYRQSPDGLLNMGTGTALASVGELLDKVTDKELRDFILRQGASGAFDNPEKLLGGGVIRIKSKVFERRKREITRELRNTTLDARRQADLLAEKLHVDAELSRLQNLKTARGAASE